MKLDLVIRGGTVGHRDRDVPADVGIVGERIAAIGRGLPPGRTEIDATGRLVLPGGVDSHCHIEQLTASGLMNADTFASATGSAAIGGTTTVIPFAAQHVGMSLARVVEDYHEAARRGAVVDYAFHMILCDPRPEMLRRGAAAAGARRPRLAQGVLDLRPAARRGRPVPRRARGGARSTARWSASMPRTTA